jgi:hypothetical protein
MDEVKTEEFRTHAQIKLFCPSNERSKCDDFVHRHQCRIFPIKHYSKFPCSSMFKNWIFTKSTPWKDKTRRGQCKLVVIKNWPVKGLCGRRLSVRLRTPYPPPLHTHCIRVHCIHTYSHREGGEGRRVEPERRLEGQHVTKLGRKYQHDWLYLQSMNSDKHLHCTENSIYVFPEKELRGLNPTFICLWAIYIFPGSVHIFGCRKID